MTVDELIEYLQKFKLKTTNKNPHVYIEIGYSKFDLEESTIGRDYNDNLVIDFSELEPEDIT